MNTVIRLITYIGPETDWDIGYAFENPGSDFPLAETADRVRAFKTAEQAIKWARSAGYSVASAHLMMWRQMLASW